MFVENYLSVRYDTGLLFLRVLRTILIWYKIEIPRLNRKFEIMRKNFKTYSFENLRFLHRFTSLHEFKVSTLGVLALAIDIDSEHHGEKR